MPMGDYDEDEQEDDLERLKDTDNEDYEAPGEEHEGEIEYEINEPMEKLVDKLDDMRDDLEDS